MTVSTRTRFRLALLALTTITGTVIAASPADVDRGRQLFSRSWSPGNPTIGSDGLGPLFNASSCVACHHQGGIGGGGDSRFNAISLGIESIDFSDGLTRGNAFDQRFGATLVNQFYLGFIKPNGDLVNTQVIPHHSLSSKSAHKREQLLSQLKVEFSDAGGPMDEGDTRFATASTLLFTSRIGDNSAVIRARIFQRNTPPVFGSGLIDDIPEDVIEEQEKLQERHPEISGRVSRLRDSSIGRFGWRANVSQLVQFVDRACANELGLETKRRWQTADPNHPAYRNPTHDIDDGDIESMSMFVSQLRRPVRIEPSTPNQSAVVEFGESKFASVGCAVCHVPNLGRASGLYSDLLLHDMGPNLYDYDAAEPHVVRYRLTNEYRDLPPELSIPYYGSPTVFRPDSLRGSMKSPRRDYRTNDYVPIQSGRELSSRVLKIGPGQVTSTVTRQEIGMERRLQPSNTSQEWRTTPLWGVRDSAPYMHDGRAETLLEAIAMHDGEAAGTRDRFLQLSLADRNAILKFLQTLVAPPDVPRVPM